MVGGPLTGNVFRKGFCRPLSESAPRVPRAPPRSRRSRPSLKNPIGGQTFPSIGDERIPLSQKGTAMGNDPDREEAFGRPGIPFASRRGPRFSSIGRATTGARRKIRVPPRPRWGSNTSISPPRRNRVAGSASPFSGWRRAAGKRGISRWPSGVSERKPRRRPASVVLTDLLGGSPGSGGLPGATERSCRTSTQCSTTFPWPLRGCRIRPKGRSASRPFPATAPGR